MTSNHERRERRAARASRGGRRDLEHERKRIHQRRERLVAWVTILGIPLLIAAGDMLLKGHGNLPVRTWVEHEAGFFLLCVVCMSLWAAYAHRYPAEKQRNAAAAYEARMRGRTSMLWERRRAGAPHAVSPSSAAVTPADKVMVVIMLLVLFANGYVMARQTYELIYEPARSPFVLWSFAVVVGLVLSGVELLIGHTERGRPWWRSYSTALMVIAELGITSARIYLDVSDRNDVTTMHQVAENALFIVIAIAGPWANRWLGPKLADWLGGTTFGGALKGALKTIGLGIAGGFLCIVGWIWTIIERVLALIAWVYLAIERFIWRLLFGGDDGDDDRPRDHTSTPSSGSGSGNGTHSLRDGPTSDRVPTLPTSLAALALVVIGVMAGCTRSDGAPGQHRGRPSCVADLLGPEFQRIEPTRTIDDRGDRWWICAVDLSGSNDNAALAELDVCVRTAETLDPTIGIWITFVTGEVWIGKDILPIQAIPRVRWEVPRLPCDPPCAQGSFRATACVDALRTWLQKEDQRRNATEDLAVADAQAKRAAALTEWYEAIHTEIEALYRQPHTERAWIKDGSSYAEYYEKMRKRIDALRLKIPIASVTSITMGDFIQERRDRRGRLTIDRAAFTWASRQRGDCTPPLPLKRIGVPVTAYLIRTPPDRIRHSEQPRAEQWASAMERMLQCADATLPLDEPLWFLDDMALPTPQAPERPRLANQ